MTKIIKSLKIKINNSSGFTLIELLIYMGLMSIFIIVLTDIFVAILDVKAESESISNVEQDGRYILARLNYDIQRANSITVPANLGSSSASLSIVIGGITYSYSLNNNNLQLTNNFGSNNLNSSETTISNTSFQKIGNVNGKETIKLQFTVNSVTQRTSGSETRIFQTTVGRR